VVERPEDPFASLDFAVLGSVHVISEIGCWGREVSDVLGSHWTHVTVLRTVGVSSPGLNRYVPQGWFALVANGSGKLGCWSALLL